VAGIRSGHDDGTGRLYQQGLRDHHAVCCERYGRDRDPDAERGNTCSDRSGQRRNPDADRNADGSTHVDSGSNADTFAELCRGRCTQRNRWNIRAGASTSTKSYGRLVKNTTVDVYEKVGSWYRVRVSATGLDGYIYAKYINLTQLKNTSSSGTSHSG
jgi:hypothetical protein